jgi:hypothetical protein
MLSATWRLSPQAIWLGVFDLYVAMSHFLLMQPRHYLRCRQRYTMAPPLTSTQFRLAAKVIYPPIPHGQHTQHSSGPIFELAAKEVIFRLVEGHPQVRSFLLSVWDSRLLAYTLTRPSLLPPHNAQDGKLRTIDAVPRAILHRNWSRPHAWNQVSHACIRLATHALPQVAFIAVLVARKH